MLERRDHGAVLCSAGQLGGQDQWPVEPRAEPVGDQVVGLAGGEVGGVVTRVGEGQAHREQRDGEDHQHEPAQPSRTGRAGVARCGSTSTRTPARPRAPADWSRPGRWSRSMARPEKPSMAGSKVRADNITAMTARIVPTARPSRYCWPIRNSPHREMMHGGPGEEHGPSGRGHGPDDGVAGGRGLRRGPGGSG